MVEFLNTEKAYSKIVEIVSKVDNRLVLISPYIKIPKPLMERLKYMDGTGIKTVVVCREKNLDTAVRGDLRQLKNLELRFDEDLHAKCFYNEKSMVITSLNLYEHSQQNNREMGVLLSLEEDSNIFKEALNEAEFIVGRAKKDSIIRGLVNEIVKEAKSVLDSPAKDGVRRTKTSSTKKNGGCCIRCKTNIPLDPSKPYCEKCFKVWVKYEDLDYKEKYCHWCGKTTQTTIEYPLCRSCYNKYR